MLQLRQLVRVYVVVEAVSQLDLVRCRLGVQPQGIADLRRTRSPRGSGRVAGRMEQPATNLRLEQLLVEAVPVPWKENRPDVL